MASISGDGEQRLLLRLLTVWKAGAPKALSADAVADQCGDSKIATALVNDLAARGLVKVKLASGRSYCSITASGVAAIWDICGIVTPNELPNLDDAVKDGIAVTIANFYTGTEIESFLRRCKLEHVGWVSGGTKWRTLSAIFQSWGEKQSVLVYYVLVSFLSRTNLASSSDERPDLIAKMGKIVAAQGLVLTDEGKVVTRSRVAAAESRVSDEALRALHGYEWHQNELEGIAALACELAGVRTRAEALEWVQKASGVRIQKLRGDGSVTELLAAALQQCTARAGAAALAPILG